MFSIESKSPFYTVYFAPRGFARLVSLGMNIAQTHLSPFDRIIGIIGLAGAGKSMLIKGMFPGLELTNDDDGVNVRPLPLLGVEEEGTGFYSQHTYHMDVHFEAAFTQKHALAEAVKTAVSLGKRVVIEHFDMLYSMLGQNADLLIGIGEEVVVTRPTVFGPEPDDIANMVFKSQPIRKQTHSAEDLCEYVMRRAGLSLNFTHSDVRHGFIFSFEKIPDIDISLDEIEKQVLELIDSDIRISFKDDTHITIGDNLWLCHGPRMHVKSAREIKHFQLNKEFITEPVTGRFLLVGTVGEGGDTRLSDLNKID
jgi:hypothetical protein